MAAPLNEIKQHLRIDSTDEDALLVSLWDAAVLKLENLTRRVIRQKQIEIFYDEFEEQVLISYFPIVSVDAVEYRDLSGNWQPYVDWLLDAREIPPKILRNQGATWPLVNAALMSVKITITAGYPVLPPDLFRAALILVGTWHEHREALSETVLNRVPMTVDYLVAGYKLPRLG